MGQVSQFLPFLLMFVVIYFFMIRPQQKKIKQEKEFETGLKVGDKILPCNPLLVIILSPTFKPVSNSFSCLIFFCCGLIIKK